MINGIVIIDRLGKIIVLNDAAERIAGVKKTEVLSRPIKLLNYYRLKALNLGAMVASPNKFNEVAPRYHHLQTKVVQRIITKTSDFSRGITNG